MSQTSSEAAADSAPTETGSGGEDLVLTGCDLSGADLTGARLPGADLRGSLLGDLDPRAVELRGALVDVAQALHLVGTLGLEVR